MSENTAPATAPATPPLTAWGTGMAAVSCRRCHCSYLVPCDTPQGEPAAGAALKCPICSQDSLEFLPGGLPELAHPYPPELLVPFSLLEAKLAEGVRGFAAGIPFPPLELTSAVLRSRLAALYLPMWLVDGVVSACWQAEAGFDYQVLSHQELYEQSRGGWKSREVMEPRVRWENRIGQINRAYQNVPVPALDDAARLEKRLGQFHLDSALSYAPSHILPDPRQRPAVQQNANKGPAAAQVFIRMPDHPPQAASREASAAFQKTAAEDCQRACAANHLRQFRWKAQVNRPNWTLMLLPVYATWYQDDRGTPHTVLIHGQTGVISGERRASVRRAGRAALAILVVSVLLFLAGLLLDTGARSSPSLGMISTYIAILGIAGILASSIPLIVAWDYNRRQRLSDLENTILNDKKQ